MPGTPKYALPEIERRWLVAEGAMPNLEGERVRQIEDLYLEGTQVRIRAVWEKGRDPIYKMGKKYLPAQAHSTPVVTLYLSEQEYQVFSRLAGRFARKERWSVAGGALDVCETPRHEHRIVEMEFASAQDGTEYLPPAFVGKEVTGDPEYSGFALALGATGLA